MKAMLGTKIGMTQVISETGSLIPVTLVLAGPITITQIKTVSQDGYNALQVAYGNVNKVSKPLSGHVKAANVKPKFLREFRVDEIPEGIKVGDTIDLSDFNVGDRINATATSKGKGFAGNIKRHNFNTSRHTHGGKGDIRKPGSIGSMYPQKVFKGKKMAGHMGYEQVTIRNLEVAYIDRESNLLGLKGAVPGPRRGLVVLGGKA